MADQPTSIFDGQPQETPEPTNNSVATTVPTSQNGFTDLLQSIVNERGEPKYKTVQDALYGLKHAQEYIPQVKEQASQSESRIKELEAELKRLSGLEETVLELTKRQEQTNTNVTSLGEEEIAKLVERTFNNKQQQDVQKANTTAVVTILSEKFGAEAEKVFYTKATEMGMTIEEMNAMAARSPKAILTLLGVNEQVAHKQTNIAPTKSSFNTNQFQHTPTSYIGRETNNITIGHTSADLKVAVDNASKMMEQLAKEGHDSVSLSNPKVFNQIFK